MNDNQIISEIADRAFDIYENIGVKTKKIHIVMDLTMTHENGCPLRLFDLLKADDFNFAHDIGGINRNLNHETYQLDNCFIPRFAA